MKKKISKKTAKYTVDEYSVIRIDNGFMVTFSDDVGKYHRMFVETPLELLDLTDKIVSGFSLE